MEQPQSATSSRDRLLHAALATIDEIGIERATTRRIADRAGANVQLIQYYFGGKDGLIEEAQRYVVQAFFEELAPVVEGAKSLEDAIRKGVAASWALALKSPEIVQPDLLLQSVRAGRADRSKERPRQTQVRLRKLLDDLLARTGQRLTMPLDAYMLILIAGLAGLILEHRVTGDTKRVAAAVDAFGDLMVGCVLPIGE